VHIPDAKNSKNDLRFCTVQTFDSAKLAKEYTALLALFHFQPTIPLERKLPKPFDIAWLDLVGSNSAKKVSAESINVVSFESSVQKGSTFRHGH
jgi:hypothetical protein